MADELANNPPEEPGEEAEHPTRWPRRQVYFVSVDWLDEPHRPESTERLARAIRRAIEHGHHPGPDGSPSSFTVRVKAGEVVTELSGMVKPHRHPEG